MFKEFFVESNNVFYDDDYASYGIDTDIFRFGSRYGELSGVVVTKENARQGKIAERWLFKPKDENLDKKYPAPSGYEVFRYVTRTTLSGGMAPVIAVNPSKGTVIFPKDYDADLEDFEWGRPLKVQYLRLIKG